VTIFSTVIAVHMSQGYNRLLEKFFKFDNSASSMPCPPDVYIQAFYLLYALFVGAHNFICSVYYTSIPVYILLAWNLFCSSTTLVIVQYIVYIRMLRDRYKLANNIFRKSKLAYSIVWKWLYDNTLINSYGHTSILDFWLTQYRHNW